MNTRRVANSIFNACEGIKRPMYVFIEVIQANDKLKLCMVDRVDEKPDILVVLLEGVPVKDRFYLEALATIGTEYLEELSKNA